MTSSVEHTGRVEWVDASRCIAMFFIVAFHCSLSPGAKACIEPFFLTAWVQFFFFLSGYFYAKRPPVSGLDTRRFWLLFRPYLAWCLIYLLLNCLPDVAQAWRQDGWRGGLLWIVSDGFGLGRPPANLPLWFLRDLSLFTLFSPLFLRCPLAVRWLITAALICFPAHLFISEEYRHVFPLVPGLRVFCLGMVLAPVSLERARRTLFAAPGALLSVCLAFSLLWYIHQEHYGEVATWMGIAGIGAAGVLTEKRLPGAARFLASLAPMMFLIYASHVTLITLIFKIAIPLGFPVLPDWFWFVVVIPLLFYLPYKLFFVLERCCPGLLPWLAATRVERKTI